jgi:hypothetical protein
VSVFRFQKQKTHRQKPGSFYLEPIVHVYDRIFRENESLKISVQFYKSEVEKRDEEIEQLKKEIAAFKNQYVCS